MSDARCHLTSAQSATWSPGPAPGGMERMPGLNTWDWDHQVGITWAPRTPVEKSYLNISADPRMESSPDYWSRMDFWDQTVRAGC